MKTIFELDSLAFPLKVERSSRGYRVTYGQQVVNNLTYKEAAHELGECIFHALGCEGLMEDE